MFSLVYDEEEALRESREEGREEKAFDIARNMLLDGDSVEKVMKCTRLTHEEVEDVKRQLVQ